MTGISVLIVGDNTATREVMRSALQAEGYGVLEAGDGESALQIVAAGAPALVVLDTKLPDMDGIGLGRQLLALAPGLAIIAAVGWAQTDEARLLAAGFLDALVKPVEGWRLVETVRRHVGRPPPRSTISGATVLLVEDDATQRKLAELVLGDAGFNVVLAEDGEAAFRLAVEYEPDAILSDILMPRMDGFALCKAIRADPKLARVPIVLMSAHYLEQEDRELAARLGASYVSRTGGFESVVCAVVDAMNSPVPLPGAPLRDESQSEHLHRITHQLERQANLSVGLAHRASLQASALSVLDNLSNSLTRQDDPSSTLGDTLAQCLEASGLSAGAVLLHSAKGKLCLQVQVGLSGELDWEPHTEILEQAVRQGGLMMPSTEARAAGDELLAVMGAQKCVVAPILACGETFGVLLFTSRGDALNGIEGEDAVRAVRAVATQLGQALVLSRAFSQLRSAEQRYRIILENAHDAISISTPGGTIIEVNRRMEELLGLPRDQLVGSSIGHASGKGNAAVNEAAYMAAVADGGGSVSPVPITRPDGSVVRVEFSVSIVEIEGESCVLNIGRDVSARLLLEEQLRQSQKMEAIGRLAGGIAHDFNNVLSVIMSYGELLLLDLKEGEPMREDVEEIRRAAARAAGLTRQLLMFSRQQVVEPKVLDLNDVLLDVDRMLQRILGKDVELVSLPGAQLGRVHVDPGSIEQLIVNLVINARDAMPTGGKLTMETTNVTLDEIFARQHHGATAGPHVMLSVSDTGVGMDKATQSRIFEPFFTTKGARKGTGLGLSTVFGIVQQGGGSIWVYSEVDHGTTFKIYLPCVDAMPVPIRSSQAPTIQHGTETILLVEDDEQVRAVASSILRKHGYDVLEARNAGEALLCAEGHHGAIDLLLTDVVMAQMSGPQLAKRLAPLRPAMKLLCMSGYTDDSVVRHGVLNATIPYLQKPFTPGVLTTKIRTVLDRAEVDLGGADSIEGDDSSRADLKPAGASALRG